MNLRDLSQFVTDHPFFSIGCFVLAAIFIVMVENVGCAFANAIGRVYAERKKDRLDVQDRDTAAK